MKRSRSRVASGTAASLATKPGERTPRREWLVTGTPGCRLVRMSERGVAPGLLLAMPQLSDQNFGRSVVLMVEHTQESSFGLIVNRRSDTPMSEVMTLLDVTWAESDDRVWIGGPVTPRGLKKLFLRL